MFAVLAWTMVLGILSQKFALLLTSQTPLQLIVLIGYASLALLALYGKAHCNVLSLVLTLAFLGSATIANLFTAPAITSLAYVYAVYAPMPVRVKLSRPAYMRHLNLFQTLNLFVSGWVFLDWGFQFAGLPMPNVEHHLLEFFRYFNFNYIQPLEWGSPWLKPNAYFFLEVSFVAQSIATALVLELCLFRRVPLIGVYAIALIVSFSGTGLLLVALCLPVIVFYLRPKLIALALVATPIAVGTAFGIGLVDNAIHRSDEFSHEGASGNQRFLGQVEAVTRSLGKQPMDAFVGIGAGQMLQNGRVVWNPITKVTVEYGVFVALIYFAMIFTAVFGKGKPFIVGYVLLVQFLFLNGGFLVPIIVFTILILSGFIEIEDPPRASPPISSGLLSSRSKAPPARHGQEYPSQR